MVAVEARSPEPLIPVRFFTNRTRVTSNVLSLALFAAFLGYVFLLTLYMQQVLGYSPLKTGELAPLRSRRARPRIPVRLRRAIRSRNERY
jgi:hypothetical protein